MGKKPHHYIIPSKHNKNVPHILSEVSFVVVVLMFVGIFMFTTLGKVIIQKTSLLSLVQSVVLVDLANESRRDTGIHTLKLNPELVLAAHLKATDMATKGYFAHTSPEGVTPWHWFKEAKYSYRYAGENLAVNFSDSINVNQAWLDSPTHRENLMQEKFTEIGIATAQGMYKGKETTFVVQLFGSPKNPKPTAVIDKDEESLVAGVSNTEISFENFVEPEVIVEEDFIVLGETVTETETFIAIESPVEEENEVEILTIDEDPVYSTLLGKIIVNPSKTAQYIYLAIGSLIVLSLILMSFVELKYHQKKHFFYGIVLVILLLFFVVINKEVLASVFTIL